LTVRVEIPYRSGTVGVEVPDGALVLRPVDLPALPEPSQALLEGLRRPLAGPSLQEIVRPGAKVVVVFPDITRPMPNKVVLPPLLGELRRLGAASDDVTLLCSTGTHRPATPGELEELVGPDIAAGYSIHQHVATDGDHLEVGVVDGAPVRLDRRYVEADVRIVTGFVEPHFFAGFSGGPKAVCPGVASLDTILEAHSPARILHPAATWVELDANPVHSFINRATALLPPDMSVDVAINGERHITAVFAGSLPDAHRKACEHVRRTAVQSVPEPFDVVVAGNAGLPLDRNLYQAVKGMAAAERVVRAGGDIVMLSSCIDGFPDDGPFASLVRAAPSPQSLVDPRGVASQDTWQAQVLGRILSKAKVHLYTQGLAHDEVRSVHLDPVDDPSKLVAELVSRRKTLCVLPDGPLTVATVTAG
jgi:nickel-dependent lactate racemase